MRTITSTPVSDPKRHRVFLDACVAATVVLLCARPAVADHVTLKNSDALTGSLAAVSKSDLTLDTELVGRVTVKWASVTAFTTATPIRLRLTGGRTAEGIAAVT